MRRPTAKRKPYPGTINDAEWAFEAPWRLMPNDFPPWEIVCRPMLRWVAAGCFEALVHDRRARDMTVRSDEKARRSKSPSPL